MILDMINNGSSIKSLGLEDYYIDQIEKLRQAEKSSGLDMLTPVYRSGGWLVMIGLLALQSASEDLLALIGAFVLVLYVQMYINSPLQWNKPAGA